MDLNFGGWLEHELHPGFEKAAGRAPVVPRHASLPPLPGRGVMIRSLASAAKSKWVIAATTAALAAGGGVGAKAAVTGNPNPFNWGPSGAMLGVSPRNQPSGCTSRARGVLNASRTRRILSFA